MNQIRAIIQNRIDTLIRLAETAGTIKHRSSVGNLREGYLVEFVRELIPSGVSITSGFLTDALGTISPQLDLILTHNSSLPIIAMQEGLSVVPIESAILVAEIKSTLTTSDLMQIESQNTSIASMKPSGKSRNEFIVPTYVFAYDTNVSKERLRAWMEQNPNTVAFCMIKKFSMIKGRGEFSNGEHGIDYYGTLAFVANFYGMIDQLLNLRDFDPHLFHYLTGVLKEKKN